MALVQWIYNDEKSLNQEILLIDENVKTIQLDGQKSLLVKIEEAADLPDLVFPLAYAAFENLFSCYEEAFSKMKVRGSFILHLALSQDKEQAIEVPALLDKALYTTVLLSEWLSLLGESCEILGLPLSYISPKNPEMIECHFASLKDLHALEFVRAFCSLESYAKTTLLARGLGLKSFVFKAGSQEDKCFQGMQQWQREALCKL